MEDMEITKFDISEYLDDKAMIAEYLNTVLKEGGKRDIITAMGHITKALNQ